MFKQYFGSEGCNWQISFQSPTELVVHPGGHIFSITVSTDMFHSYVFSCGNGILDDFLNGVRVSLKSEDMSMGSKSNT